MGKGERMGRFHGRKTRMGRLHGGAASGTNNGRCCDHEETKTRMCTESNNREQRRQYLNRSLVMKTGTTVDDES